MLLKSITTFVFSFFALAAQAKEMQAQRSDGSKVNYYIDEPTSNGAYPLLIVLQDTDCQSVKSYHEQVASKLSSYVGAAVVTVDKRGLPAGSTSCTEAYKSQNTLAARIEDYKTVVADLKKHVPNWDKRLAFAGFGEGGLLAPAVAAEFPETVAVGIMAAAGGLSRTDELKLIQKRDGEVCGILTPGKLDMQLNEILRDSSSTKTWCGDTQSYKWWASSLKFNAMTKLSSLDMPIYIAHGTADLIRPVESADAAVEKLRAQGRNVTYDRYEGYDHLFNEHGQSRMQSVMLKAIGWMRDVFNQGRFFGTSDPEELQLFSE